ncbi:retrovirus-related pol polyprotein from transposon TNT 1-94 [Tanacetum coccineum]|uniref:Retrovirus-related pol polyprotein from transposon TNT 1-94 n=1 Tax=Tanacetum coccineum TaxID=301880 RepID=A0ABQ4WLU4_9ASTR
MEESLNVMFGESLPKYRTSSLVDDDVIEEHIIQNHNRTQNLNCHLEEVIPRVENIKKNRDHPIDQVIGELDERTLRSHAQDRSNFFAFVSIIEPKNIKEAIKDESWTMTMQEELDQFICNDVWDLVTYPLGHTIIGTKWIYRNKLDENGVVCRNKDRLVTQGYNQQEEIDYDETYAPVARFQEDPKQTSLANSITKSEYVAAERACQQALWMKQAFVGYNIMLDEVPILCGDKCAINLTSSLIDY